MAAVLEGTLQEMISNYKMTSFPYYIGNYNRIIGTIPLLNQPLSSYYARKIPQQKMQLVLRYWRIITKTLERLNLYGTVNYESRIFKIYEKVSGNPYFSRAGDFLDAIIFGFTINDCLILLTVEDIYSEAVKLKTSYVELALWLETLQQKQRQLQANLIYNYASM